MVNRQQTQVSRWDSLMIYRQIRHSTIRADTLGDPGLDVELFISMLTSTYGTGEGRQLPETFDKLDKLTAQTTEDISQS